MATWVEFRYRDFFDVPRMIVFRHQGRDYLLDCPFDETSSEYPDRFEIFLLADMSAEALQGSWVNLRQFAERHIGTVKVDTVRFDPTRRHQLDLTSLPPLTS